MYRLERELADGLGAVYEISGSTASANGVAEGVGVGVGFLAAGVFVGLAGGEGLDGTGTFV